MLLLKSLLSTIILNICRIHEPFIGGFSGFPGGRATLLFGTVFLGRIWLITLGTTEAWVERVPFYVVSTPAPAPFYENFFICQWRYCLRWTWLIGDWPMNHTICQIRQISHVRVTLTAYLNIYTDWTDTYILKLIFKKRLISILLKSQ